MNTVNAVGYLAGALIASPTITRAGSRRAFVASMLISALALAASASSGALGVLLALRLLAGVAGAVTFIAGASLAAQVAAGAPRGRAALVLGVYLAGGGLGVVVSGVVVPGLLAATGTGGWRWGWIALGSLSLVATAAALPAVRRCPQPPTRDRTDTASRWRPGRVWPAIGAYALFGAGYIAYVTFIVSYIKGHGAGPVQISAFWVVLGAAAIAATFAWGPALDRLRGGRGIAAATATVTIGTLIPLLSATTGATFASAVIFGASFLTVPAAATAFARTSHRPEQWTVAIAALTIAFALGQCLGPVLAGVLSDGPSGVRAGLILSAATLAAGALLALTQPHRDPSAGARPAPTR